MYDRAYAVATGAFIVVAIAALALTAFWLAGIDQERRPYVVVSRYSVAGLAEGSEVLYRGVPAGRVERIGIDPEDPAQVLIEIGVDERIPVLETTFARLQQRGLTGVAQVELAFAGTDAQPLPTSAAEPARIPMEPSLLDEVSDAGTQALAIVEEIADTLEQALNEENRERLRAIVARADALLSSAEHVAATLETDLPPALESASRAADSVTALAERTTQSMDEVDALIAELRATTAVARQIGEELAADGVSGLDRAIAAASSAAQEISRLARDLAREPSMLLRGREARPGPGEE